MTATARVIWLCACVRYWPYRGLVLSVSLAFIINISQYGPRALLVRDSSVLVAMLQNFLQKHALVAKIYSFNF